MLRAVLTRARALSAVIDVSRMDHIDGRCINVLLLGYTWALQGGHGYEVVDARGAVRRVREVAGLCASHASDEVLHPPVWFEAIEFLPTMQDSRRA